MSLHSVPRTFPIGFFLIFSLELSYHEWPKSQVVVCSITCVVLEVVSKWYHKVVSQGGITRWYHKVVSQGGIKKWYYKVASLF